MMNEIYDVIVIGGGPAGAVSSMLLARAGLRVIVLEKTKFPRFHIGESILPRNFPLLEELGLADELRKLPHMPKFGAEFGMGDDFTSRKFTFNDGLLGGSPTFNIERAVFDEMLLKQARLAGAEVRESTTVKRITKLTQRDVRIALADDVELRGRWLIDASGCSTVVGRHLNLRKNFDDPELQKVAYFQHFRNVQLLDGIEAGHPGIFMNKEGWFWIIPINREVTSVGFVAHPNFVKQLDVAPNRLLKWAIARCPVVRERMKNAQGEETNEILADFSYRCEPYAGDGYFLVGDAAAFLDPIFSTGVTLAMMAAREAATKIVAVEKRELSVARARKDYINFVTRTSKPFWYLIRRYYQHSFRELFMNRTGPANVHGAIISILAGQIFPKMPWCLRWRLWLFELFIQVHKFVPLVPRRSPCSLLDQKIEQAVPA